MPMLILALVVIVALPTFAADLLLENAQIVDVGGQEIRAGHIVVRDEHIVTVLTQPPGDFDGTRRNLAGHWVIPGLYDLYTHAYGNPAPTGTVHRLGVQHAARAMLYAGVTGFLDLFSEENGILELRDRQRAGQLQAPDELLADIHAAGPVFTCSGGHGTEYGVFTRVINTSQQAHLEIAALAYKKPDVIKIVYDHAFTRFPTLDRATLQAAIATAKRFQVQTVIHIGTWQDAEEAIQDGANAITHTHAAPVPDRLVQLMRARGTVYIPTLAVHAELVNMREQPDLLARPLLTAMVPAGLLETYRQPERFTTRASGWLQGQQHRRARVFQSFQTLLAAGVPTLAGTDVGNLGTFQGYSLHRELELMVAHGATPWQALAAATTLAGRFLKEEVGIRPGALANLVVLDASPVADIQNTTRITTVLYRGHVVDRQALQGKITQGFAPEGLREHALGLSQVVNAPVWSFLVASTLSIAYALSRRGAEALGLLKQAVARVAMPPPSHYSLRFSEVYLLAGHLEEASGHARESLASARTHKERGDEAWGLRLFGDIAAQHEPPQIEPAKDYYRQALALADELGMRPLQAHCHRGLGTLYAAPSQREPARSELTTAADLREGTYP